MLPPAAPTPGAGGGAGCRRPGGPAEASPGPATWCLPLRTCSQRSCQLRFFFSYCFPQFVYFLITSGQKWLGV